MANPQTDLVNEALDLVGEDPIGDLFDASDARALICRRHFDDVRLTVMRDSEWNSLEARMTLPSVVMPTEFAGEWDHAYQLPVDCVKVRRVAGTNQSAYRQDFGAAKIAFRIAQKLLLSNETTVILVYTKDQPVTPLFDAGLYRAIVLLMASQLAAAIPRDFKRAEFLRSQYEAELKNSQGADEDEGKDMVHTNRLRSVRFS